MNRKDLSTLAALASAGWRVYSLVNGHEPACLCGSCAATNACLALALLSLVVA